MSQNLTWHEPSLPCVSVIIRTHHGRLSFLKEAIASVVAQTYPNIELIVVEDGSNEAEVEVQAHADKTPLAHVVYATIPKGGRTLAGNKGLSLARGAYLAFLDDDDLYFQDHLSVLVQTLEKQPTVQAAYGIALEARSKWVAGGWQEVSRKIVHQQPFSRALLWYRNYLPLQSVVFRRALYEKLGGFSTDLEYLEDWEFWIRYTLVHDFVFVPRVTSLYRVPASWKQAVARQRQFAEFYPKVVAKMRDLKVTLSPAEVIDVCHVLRPHLYLFSFSRQRVREFILRFSWLSRFYQGFVSLNQWWRSVCQKSV